MGIERERREGNVYVYVYMYISRIDPSFSSFVLTCHFFFVLFFSFFLSPRIPTYHAFPFQPFSTFSTVSPFSMHNRNKSSKVKNCWKSCSGIPASLPRRVRAWFPLSPGTKHFNRRPTTRHRSSPVSATPPGRVASPATAAASSTWLHRYRRNCPSSVTVWTTPVSAWKIPPAATSSSTR